MDNGEPQWVRRFVAAIGERVPYVRSMPASNLCTWRVGGPVAVVVEPRSSDELAFVAAALTSDVAVLVVGRGSNLLVSDAGFDGVVVLLRSGFDEFEVSGISRGESPTHFGVVRAGSALALPKLARRAASIGVGGLEFFVGIPGSVGGAVRMNAGGHGRETGDVLRTATLMSLDDGQVREVEVEDLALTYRHSNVGEREVVLAASFAVAAEPVPECLARVDEIVRWRREHQPGGANAGSVFTNPPGDSAGRLIESAGLKDFTVGGAVVSAKHANFIQAEPGALASDIVAVISHVRRRVFEAHGIRLQTEVRLIGYPHNYIEELTT